MPISILPEESTSVSLSMLESIKYVCLNGVVHSDILWGIVLKFLTSEVLQIMLPCHIHGATNIRMDFSAFMANTSRSKQAFLTFYAFMQRTVFYRPIRSASTGSIAKSETIKLHGCWKSTANIALYWSGCEITQPISPE